MVFLPWEGKDETKTIFPIIQACMWKIGIQSRMGEILLGIGICRNMQKLSHNKGGMNMYEPSTDWFGYVLSLSDEPHGGGMGFNFVAYPGDPSVSWNMAG